MSINARLLKKQKRELFEVANSFGFNLSEFVWTDDDMSVNYGPGMAHNVHYIVSKIVHKPSGFYCKFAPDMLELSPGDSLPVQTTNAGIAERLTLFRSWLQNLKIEVEEPDLWATIGQEKALSTAASFANVDNLPFTAADQNLIAAKLDEIKAYLLEGQQFAAEQAQFIEQEFAYLKDASKKFGRKDWLRVLLSVLIGQAINLALDPVKAKAVLGLAGTAMQWIWGSTQGYLNRIEP